MTSKLAVDEIGKLEGYGYVPLSQAPAAYAGEPEEQDVDGGQAAFV